MKKLEYLLMLTAVLISISGCDDGLSEGSAGTLASPDSSVTLPAPGVLITIPLNNTGKKAIKIKSVELKNAPPALHFVGDRSAATCPCNNTTEICIVSSCYKIKDPSSFLSDLPAQQTIFFTLALSSDQISCQPAGPDVPEQFKSNYCGEIHVETDATNSSESEQIKNGNATIYLQKVNAPDALSLQKQTVNFEGVIPNSISEDDFGIFNDSDTEVTLQKFNIPGLNNATLSIEPSLPLTIPAKGSQKFKITLNLNSFPLSQPFTQEARITTTPSVRGNAALIVNISSDEGDSPLLTYNKSMLSFQSGDSQNLILTNHGSATLLVRKLRIYNKSKQIKEDWYALKDNGENISLPLKIPKGDSKTITIEKASDDANNQVALLELTTNEPSTFAREKIEIILVGKDLQAGPYIRRYPSALSYNYSREDSEKNKSLPVVFTNLGTVEYTLPAPTKKPDYLSFNVFDTLKTISPNSLTTIDLERINFIQSETNSLNFSSAPADADKNLSNGITSTLDPFILKQPITTLISDQDPRPPMLTLYSAPETSGQMYKRITFFLNTTNNDECMWLLTKRPHQSHLVVYKPRVKCKEPIKIRPDAQGEYEMTVINLNSKGYSKASKSITVSAP